MATVVSFNIMARITLDDLAAMVKNRFDELDSKIVTNHRIVVDRLDKIENSHTRSIDRLEDDMRVVKTRIGIK